MGLEDKLTQIMNKEMCKTKGWSLGQVVDLEAERAFEDTPATGRHDEV